MIRRERAGGYLGKTVQVIPHITDEIKRHIYEAAGGRGSRDRRSGRHRRRHRELAVSRSDSSDESRTGRRERHVRPSDARSLYRGGRRAQDQAHSALRQRAARDRDSARYLALPLGSQDPERGQRQDRSLLQSRRAIMFSARSTSRSIYEVPLYFHEEGLDEKDRREAGHLDRPSGSFEVEGDGREDPQAQGRSHDRDRRQVHRLARQLQVARPKRSFTAASPTTSKVNMIYIDSEEIEKGNLESAAFGRRDSGSRRIRRARHRRQDQGDRVRAHRRRSVILASALGLQLAVIEFARNVAGLEECEFGRVQARGRTKTSSTSWNRKRRSRTRAARCAWARIPARSCSKYGGKPTQARSRLTAESRSPSAIAIALKSRTRFARASKKRDCSSSGKYIDKETGIELVEMVEIPDHPWFLGCQFHPEFLSRPSECRIRFSALSSKLPKNRATGQQPTLKGIS